MFSCIVVWFVCLKYWGFELRDLYLQTVTLPLPLEPPPLHFSLIILEMESLQVFAQV
jgi:hypothetical protein